MKVAHFAIFAPYASGQYGTVKDLIMAERLVGVDAQFIDYGYNNQASVRVGLKDDDIETMPLEWIKNADIVMRHTAVSPEVDRLNLPVVTVLHGRPESSFMLELYGKNPVISIVLRAKKRYNHAGFLTFWKEYIPQWSALLGGEEVFYVPSPIDLSKYEDVTEGYDFAGKSGSPNIVIADTWRGRRDTTPFNILMAAAVYKRRFNKKAKVHIYALPRKGSLSFLIGLKKLDILGELRYRVKGLTRIFSNADMLITPHVIATRLIREALAVDLPFVAGGGCKYTRYSADARNIELYARAIDRCWTNTETVEDIRLRKEMRSKFELNNVGKSIKKVLEDFLISYKKKIL